MSDVPPASTRPDGRPPGTPRAGGLASTGRRYALTVAALSGLAALPTLAALALGSASLHLGSPGRSPFVVPLEPGVVVVPDRDHTPPRRLAAPPAPRLPLVRPLAALDHSGVTSLVPWPVSADPAGGGPTTTGPGGPTRSGTGRPWPDTHPQAARGRAAGAKVASAKAATVKAAGAKAASLMARAQLPGRSIAGWSRVAGPRR